jgi:hypothetical protein
MKRIAVLGLATLMAAALLAAEPGEAVKGAAAKLGQQTSYSWNATTKFGEFTSTAEGKILKDGLTALKMTFGDSTTEAFLKDGKGAVKPPEQEWQSLAELAKATAAEPGPSQFLVRWLQNFKAPAAEAADLASKAKELTKDGDAFASDFTELGAKELLTMGRRRNANAPEPKNARGSVKFWVKDGLLTKFEFKLQGTISFNGEDRDIDRTTTFDIKDVGTTKVEVPEAAQSKLSLPAPDASK